MSGEKKTSAWLRLEVVLMNRHSPQKGHVVLPAYRRRECELYASNRRGNGFQGRWRALGPD